jgi:hypothetical protein
MLPKAPRYRRHMACNQAHVRIDGEQIDLGP